MDRNTLSHYGWIVVLTLILACLLAFASPFGLFINDAISSFTGGFIDTNNAAMDQIDPNAGKIPADECSHENIELQNEKSATCVNNGYTGDKVCTDCGTKMETGTVTAKLDHTPVTDNAVPATCEQEGKSEGSHCSVCKTTLVAQTKTDALGHDWGEPFVAEKATCLGNGISRIECQREGCDAHTDSTIKAEGHTTALVKGKAATCTATGLTDGEKCSVCGTVTKQQQTIPALNHTVVKDSAIQASCEVAGKTEGSHCSVCHTIIKAQETVPALGHDMGSPVTTLTASCTSEGQTKTSCKRTGCGYYEVGKISATGHTEVIDKAVAATCTATGLTEGKHCSVCGAVIKAQTTVAKAPHTSVTDKAVSATCTKTGLTAGSHCSVCNAVLTAQTATDALGHDMGNPVTTTKATCTTVGATKTSCNRCDYYETGTITATGHTEVIDKAVDATCTATGLTVGKHCSVCNTVLTAQTTTPALGHKYNSVVTKKATCTEEGIITYTCIRNDHSYTETTPALGHTDTNPADDNCDRCGDVIKEVEGLGEVEVNNPDAEITYDPDTGDVGGIIPPASEPADPIEIPEEVLPNIIEFNYGKFDSNSTFIPGTYETVPYERTYLEIKMPVNYDNIIWSKWNVTKDGDGNIIRVVPKEIELADIDTKYSTYIIYDFTTEQYLEMEGVKGDSVELWAIHNESDDTLDNIIYLAACVYYNTNNQNLHIAKWDGTKYIAVDYDEEIITTDAFFVPKTVTEYKTVEITAPSASVNYVYVPVGTLQAEEGMTWREWLASDYNTTGYSTPTIKTADFEDVSYDDVIVAGQDYGFFAYELSGTWKWNDEIVFDKNMGATTQYYQDINFTSYGENFRAIKLYSPEGIMIALEYTFRDAPYGDGIGLMEFYKVPYGDGLTQYWYDELKTMDFGSEPQTVSKEFYEWFVANATQQNEYTLSGTWMFNDTITGTNNITQELEFTYGGYSATKIDVKASNGSVNLYYYYNNEAEFAYSDIMGGWYSDYQTLNFGSTPQAVSKEFYEWFTANAQPILSGTWVFNDNLLLPANDIKQSINYVYGTTDKYSSDGFYVGYNGLWLRFEQEEPSDYPIYCRGMLGWDMTWTKYIDFGSTPQTVSKEFYEWFTANAKKQTITFTINGVEYQAEAGMTWAEWVESAYDNDKFIIFSSQVRPYGSSEFIAKNGKAAHESDIIEATDYSYEYAFTDPT